MFYVINMRLRHEAYGEGLLKSYEGDSVIVRFEDREERFDFPSAFDTGVLRTENKEDEARILEIKERWGAVQAERSGRTAATKATPNAAQAKAFAAVPESKATAQSGGSAPKPSRRTPTGRQGKKSFKSYMRLGFGFGEASLIVGIILTVLSIGGAICFAVGASLGELIVYYVGLASFAVFGFLAHCVFIYLSDRGGGKVAVVFLVISFIPYYLLILFVAVMGAVVGMIIELFRNEFGSSNNSNKSQKTWTVYDNGFKRKLVESDKVYVDGKWYYSFRDDLGIIWLSENKKQFFSTHRYN